MDVADLAERETETYLAECRYKLSKAKPLPAIGICYNCEEPIEDGLRYCDKSCEEDHLARKKR